MPTTMPPTMPPTTTTITTTVRIGSGLAAEQVAEQMEWSPSKLTRVEGGRSVITKVDLGALLSRHRIASASSTCDRLQALNRGARERGWWDKYRTDLSPLRGYRRRRFLLSGSSSRDSFLACCRPRTTPAWHIAEPGHISQEDGAVLSVQRRQSPGPGRSAYR